MQEPTMINLELKISAERMISAFISHQEEISQQVSEGVRRAVEEFDFAAEIQKQAISLIRNTISDFMWKGELKKLVEKKVNGIVQELVDREMKSWEENRTKNEQ